jgi:putative peptidoglycan lipid II flippase
LALIVLGRPLIGAVYQSGHFQIYDTQQTALALACYSIGLVAYASARILSPAFYALSDARTPMFISLLSIIANIAIPLLLLKVLHLNFAALALTTAIAVSLECLCLAECLRRKLGGLEGNYLKDCFLRVTAASLVMVAPLIFLDQQFAAHFPATRQAYCIELAICVPLGLLIFYCSARLFRVAEIRVASDVFVAPLRRRLAGAHAKIRS